MNIYSLNFIKKKYLFEPLDYKVQKNLHTESLSCSFINPEKSTDKGTVSFVDNGVLFRSWMSLIDMNDPKEIPSTALFEKLMELADMLQLKCISAPEYTEFLNSLDSKTYSDLAANVLDQLKEIIEAKSSLCYFYPIFYRIMVALYEFTETPDINKAINEIEKAARDLITELSCLKDIYSSAKNYSEQVFYLPYANEIARPTYQVALAYQTFCLKRRQDNFLSESFDDAQNNNYMLQQAWIDNLTDTLSGITDEPSLSFSISSMRYFLQIGIDLMIQNDMTLRRCRNCGRYFCVKYSSNQDYCNRSYSNASTCSEYAARKSYKERLFENPINTEYTKAYNRLYARIRRKKLPADTPLKDELLKLRNEYMERYEHTHKKDREAVWKEYIKKNKDLLG